MYWGFTQGELRVEPECVTVDASLHRSGDQLHCVFSTDASEEGNTVGVEARNGSAVHLTVPPAGFVVYE